MNDRAARKVLDHPPEQARRAAPRVAAIDLLRGLAVMGMIMVAYAGDWDHRFTVLTHAHWRGFALADMIFPSFLLCVGASIPYSFAQRAARHGRGRVMLHVWRRAGALVLLGILLNLLPYFDVGHVRLMGILQRIGLCYAAAGTLCAVLGRSALSARAVVAATAALLLGYGAILLLWDAPGCGRACFDSAHSLPAVIDRAVFGVHHLWPYGTTDGVVTFDPEGLLSTCGALANVLFGVLAGLLLQRAEARRALPLLSVLALALIVAALALDPLVPIIKKLWTPSFALLSGGSSLLVLVALARLTTPGAAPPWAIPIRVYGANATLAFILITLLDTFMQLPVLASGSLHGAAARHLGVLIGDARVASAVYSFALLMVVGMILLPLYRRRIFLKL